MASKPLLSGGALLLAEGCSLHPVPEDVPGLNTYMIVQRIRCEMRDAIRAAIIDEVKHKSPTVAEDLLRNPKLFEKFPIYRLHPDDQKIILNYDQGSVAY